MKRLLSILTLAGVLATPAVQAADWTGAYVGGLASLSNSGDVDYFDDGVLFSGPWPVEGTQYGGFAGYNMAFGTYVVGGEIAYSTDSVFLTDDPTSEFTDFMDLKARVGFTSGEALIYGVLGWSTGTWDDSAFGGEVSSDGLNYGAGIDFLVTDNIFIGAEFLIRDLVSDPDPGDPAITSEASIQSIAIRAGMKF